MNEWYELTNDLETEVLPLNEVSQARIRQQVQATLPHRKKRPQVVAVIAAVLLLSACGYVAATQFSSWFWNMAEDPKAPESSEDLLASMGTVIDQSQTVDGVTVTLDGAIWDGYTLMLSLALTGENVPTDYWTYVKSEDTYLRSSDAHLEASIRKQLPELSEDEVQEYLENLRNLYRGRPEISYVYNRETESYRLFIKDTRTSQDFSESEMTLHLENLEFLNSTVSGPFDFTFTVAPKNVQTVYTGRVLLEQGEDYDIYVTGAEISPLQARITFETSVPLSEEQYDSETIHRATAIDHIRVNGEEFRPSSSSGGRQEHAADGYVLGSAYTGSFDRIVDPAAVEAIRIGGVWLELSELELAESE